MALQIADRWFDWERLDEGVTLIWEPHVDPLIRCNIWHVEGGGHDLLVDSGLGMSSLAKEAESLFTCPVTAAATHTHYDHIGGLFEFDDRVVHSLEAEELSDPQGFASLEAKGLDPTLIEAFEACGCAVPDLLVDALPEQSYDLAAYSVAPAPATRLVEEGDILEIGRRRFEVLHLPGHSPGSIGLWEAASGILFSGDAIYDGPLLDELPGCSIPDYVATMKRLLELPVRVVHGGHDPSFGRERLRELALAYLSTRA